MDDSQFGYKQKYFQKNICNEGLMGKCVLPLKFFMGEVPLKWEQEWPIWMS
jgi:hypothetical protein